MTQRAIPCPDMRDYRERSSEDVRAWPLTPAGWADRLVRYSFPILLVGTCAAFAWFAYVTVTNG